MILRLYKIPYDEAILDGYINILPTVKLVENKLSMKSIERCGGSIQLIHEFKHICG